MNVTFDGDETSILLLTDLKAILAARALSPVNMLYSEKTAYTVSNNIILPGPVIANTDAYLRDMIPKNRGGLG